MKIKTSELSGAALDWAVANATGAPTSQSSTPIGNEEQCIAAGKKAIDQIPGSARFICVQGRL